MEVRAVDKVRAVTILDVYEVLVKMISTIIVFFTKLSNRLFLNSLLLMILLCVFIDASLEQASAAQGVQVGVRHER